MKITCPICRRTSHNPEDVRQKYCGYCHEYHDILLRRQGLMAAALRPLLCISTNSSEAARRVLEWEADVQNVRGARS